MGGDAIRFKGSIVRLIKLIFGYRILIQIVVRSFEHGATSSEIGLFGGSSVDCYLLSRGAGSRPVAK